MVTRTNAVKESNKQGRRKMKGKEVEGKKRWRKAGHEEVAADVAAHF